MVVRVCQEPEIYQIQVVLPDNPLKYLNSYVMPGKDRSLIIDTGFNRPECWAALKEGLDELQLDLTRTDLFLTHLHSDHSGLAPELSDLGCTIYMNPVDHDYFRNTVAGNVWPRLEERFRQEGFPQEEIAMQSSTNQARLYAPRCFYPAVPVHDGERLTFAGREFLAIATPGHTKGHTCLYLEKEQIMFLGDHVLFDITPNITCWLNTVDALGDYLSSLDKIAAYPVRLALPGHRKNEMPMDVRIGQIKEHHRIRLDRLCDIIRTQPGICAYDIAKQLPWSMRGKSWAEFPLSQKWFAMGETLSHLDHLRILGRICRSEGDPVAYRLK